MSMTFLFWNLNQNCLEGIIARLANKHSVDVLMFVECAIPSEIILGKLNQITTQYHYSPGIGCEKVEIFTRFPVHFMSHIYEENRLTVRQIKLPRRPDFLLAVTHFPSKQHHSDPSQMAESFELAKSIKFAEKQCEHSRTILVGDLNMNPFDDGVVSANGLHGTMSRRIAQRKSRVVQQREYEFFYNPMWNLLGDYKSGTPGTYYYSSSQQVTFFWNTFDQVLVRPELLPYFNSEEVRILVSDGQMSFLSNEGLPTATRISDHLPLLFTLDFEKKENLQ